MSHDPYIGVGIVYIEEVGGTAGLEDVGNSIEFGLTPNVSTIEQKNYRNVAGGTYAEETTTDSIDVNIIIGGLRSDNLVRAIDGGLTSAASTTETDETHTANLGKFISLSKLPLTITDVNDAAAGAGTSYTAVTDYVLRPGGIFIPTGSTITDASAIYVTYETKATDIIEALIASGKEYHIVFAGQNKANAGKDLRIEVYKIPLSGSDGVVYISDEFQTLTYTGKLLPDLTKNGTTESQYYKIDAEQ